MFNNKHLRCNNIKVKLIIFNQCVDIFFNFNDYNKNYIITRNEMHIILKLFCDIIIKIAILKFNNLKIHWNFDEFFIVNNYKISIVITTNHILKIKIKTILISIFIIKSNVNYFFQKHIKEKTLKIIVYINKMIIFKFNKKTCLYDIDFCR